MKKYAVTHKVITGIIIIVIFGIGYYEYKKITTTTGELRYVEAQTEKGTLVISISGSGQVSASNQIDIKPKVSGEITWINVKPGDKVKAWKALLGMDNTGAKRAVVNAEQTLITSKLQYQKDEAQSPIDYQKTIDSLATARDDLNTTFNDTFNSISNTYLDLPNIITATQNILYGFDLNPNSGIWNVDTMINYFNNDETNRQKIFLLSVNAKNDYATARTNYDTGLISYKQITRESNQNDINKLLDQTINVTTFIAQSLQSELNLIGTSLDIAQTVGIKLPTALTTTQTNARNYLSVVNNDLSNLLSQKKSISTGQQTIKTYEDNITLLKVGNLNGNNPISLQISKNNLVTQEQSLGQLKEDLNNYTIIAPFDGTIAAVNVKKGDIAGSSAVASIITDQKIAQISLNEVDAAKVKVGEKVTLSFDAINGLEITGEVAEVDTLGTVSQGVVTYTVKINFDTQDERVKPGMSVNANIITGLKQDVLIVPNSAVKSSGGTSYVEIFANALPGSTSAQGATSATPPLQQVIEVGESNDTSTEITSGLKEGDFVVIRTITTGATTNTTPSLLNSLGGNRVTGGGNTRRIGQ